MEIRSDKIIICEFSTMLNSLSSLLKSGYLAFSKRLNRLLKSEFSFSSFSLKDASPCDINLAIGAIPAGIIGANFGPKNNAINPPINNKKIIPTT